MIIIAICVPLFGGTFAQVIVPLLGYESISITTTLTTITAGIIAYTMVKYGLMTITPGMAASNIIETMNDYVVVVGIDDNITLMNKAAYISLGYGKTEMLKKPLDMILTKPQEFESKVMPSIYRHGQIKEYKTDILTVNGEKIPVSVNGSVIKGKGGDIIGYVLVMRDMREARKLIMNIRQNTKALVSAKKELEEKVKDLEKFTKLTVGRELKLKEFRARLRKLEGLKKKHKMEEDE
jgi:PAS domain S-box-containing protein